MPIRTVALLAYEGAGLLDISGPAEVFAVANALAGGDAYRTVIVSADGSDMVSSAGFRIGVASSVAEVAGDLDTFLVPGSWTWREALRSDDLLAAVTLAAGHARRIAGVCAGAFLLAAAGLLDGRRATTHWEFVDELAARYPEIGVERDPIFVRDGDVFTSAGVTSGIDLALALVEADHGADISRRVAQHLVVFMQRPGGQSQFSIQIRPSPEDPSPLRHLVESIAADPAGDHRLDTLSARAGFSARHLTRVFARELGVTPARYVERIRIEAAREMLAGSNAPLDVIARASGLGSAETLRRTFVREVGVTPHAYRRRFMTTGIGAIAS